MKNTISPSDYFEIRKISLINAKDFEYALDLYSPLVGIKNISVYFALIGEETNVISKHAELLLKYRLSCGEFQNALSYLEAVGLIASYRKDSNGVPQYIYTIMAPRTPSQFFGNELLYGTLRSNLDEEACQKIAHKYMVDDIPTDFENVSESFADLFHPDMNNGMNIQAGPKTGERKLGTLSLGFDANTFKKAISEKNPFIKSNFISQEEMVRIARITALYSYEESAMAGFVVDSYDPTKPVGSRIDFNTLNSIAVKNVEYNSLHKETLAPTKSDIHGKKATSNVIRLMDNSTAIEFLTILQHGNKPASADVRLINTLVSDMGVPENVVNALLFFLLGTNDNVIPPSSYVTKLGGSLVRSEITNALDALNYLGSHSERQKNKNKVDTQKPITTVKIEKPVKQAEVVDDEEDDDEEFERFLNS